MQFFAAPSMFMEGPIPTFGTKRITNHGALLFYLLGILQRFGPRKVFSTSLVGTVEAFLLHRIRDNEDDIIEPSYFDIGDVELADHISDAAWCPQLMRYSAPLIALYFDAFTYLRFFEDGLKQETLTQMLLASYPWISQRAELKISGNRVRGRIRSASGVWMRVSVPIANPWKRRPLTS